jgi:hypothetical protein
MSGYDDDRAYEAEVPAEAPQDEQSGEEALQAEPPRHGEPHDEPSREEPSREEPSQERFEVRGEDLITKVKELVREGNIRRIIIENEKGEILVEIPLTIGVVGAVLLPVWAAIGAIAAVATRCTIRVERRGESGDE